MCPRNRGRHSAVVTIVIVLWTLYYQLQDPAYVKGVYAALAWYVAGLAYFAFVGRHRLILSPEEEFALAKGRSSPTSASEPTPASVAS